MGLFKRRRSPDPSSHADESALPAVDPLDVLAAETVARHFDGGQASGRSAFLGFNDAAINVWVQPASPFGTGVAVPMFLNVSGGRFGKDPIFASLSGYGPSPQEAVTHGLCEWSCTFGPVLRRGLTDELVQAEDAEEFTTTIAQRAVRVTVDSYGRVVGTEDDGAKHLTHVRTELAGSGPLAKRVIGSGLLPILPADRCTLLSVFLMEGSQSRTVEVKVNGADWTPASAAFPQAFVGREGTFTMIRELAVLVPANSDPLVPERADVDRTLAGIAVRKEPQSAAGWRGWRVHRGLLGDPISSRQLETIENDTGALQDTHRRFLLEVAATGAGPGYGLLQPARVGDVIPLAHAGCGVTWVLRLDADHQGEVWLDAAGSDETYTPVASSFLAWYVDWLDSAVRNTTPWISWDNSKCATTGVLSQLLDAHPDTTDLSQIVAAEGIALTGGGNFLPDNSALDPCHGCTALAAKFGLPDDRFRAGSLSSP